MLIQVRHLQNGHATCRSTHDENLCGIDAVLRRIFSKKPHGSFGVLDRAVHGFNVIGVVLGGSDPETVIDGTAHISTLCQSLAKQQWVTTGFVASLESSAVYKNNQGALFQGVCAGRVNVQE